MQAYTGITAKKRMVGITFGNLIVLKECKDRNKHGHIIYLCKCKCGKEKEILGSSIRQGLTRSCGDCEYRPDFKHGMYNTSEYKVWSSMRERCRNEERLNYGGRGITVCDRWDIFENFFEDMGHSNGLTLERIDVNGNYEPNNCKWDTVKNQARNRTNNNIVSYKGESKCISEWCEIINMPVSTFHNRVKRGWTIEQTIELPVNKKHRKL